MPLLPDEYVCDDLELECCHIALNYCHDLFSLTKDKIGALQEPIYQGSIKAEALFDFQLARQSRGNGVLHAFAIMSGSDVRINERYKDYFDDKLIDLTSTILIFIKISFLQCYVSIWRTMLKVSDPQKEMEMKYTVEGSDFLITLVRNEVEYKYVFNEMGPFTKFHPYRPKVHGSLGHPLGKIPSQRTKVKMSLGRILTGENVKVQFREKVVFSLVVGYTYGQGRRSYSMAHGDTVMIETGTAATVLTDEKFANLSGMNLSSYSQSSHDQSSYSHSSHDLSSYSNSSHQQSFSTSHSLHESSSSMIQEKSLEVSEEVERSQLNMSVEECENHSKLKAELFATLVQLDHDLSTISEELSSQSGQEAESDTDTSLLGNLFHDLETFENEIPEVITGNGPDDCLENLSVSLENAAGMVQVFSPEQRRVLKAGKEKLDSLKDMVHLNKSAMDRINSSLRLRDSSSSFLG